MIQFLAVILIIMGVARLRLAKSKVDKFIKENPNPIFSEKTMQILAYIFIIISIVALLGCGLFILTL